MLNQLNIDFGKKSNLVTQLYKSLFIKMDSKVFLLRDFFKIFEELDKIIGRHWPLLAKSLWQSHSHPLAAAMISTSSTIGEAISNIASPHGTYLPIYKSTLKTDINGIRLYVSPNVSMTDRQWMICQELLALGFCAASKGIAKSEMQNVTFHMPYEKPLYCETFENICTTKFTYENKAPFAEFPFSFLNIKPIGANVALNNVILSEIKKQAISPVLPSSFLLQLRAMLYNHSGSRLSGLGASDKLGISRRTMDRYLSDIGVSYTKVQNEVMYEKILIGLSEHQSIGLISTNLGYANASSLNRFCKKAFGKTLNQLNKIPKG